MEEDAEICSIPRAAVTPAFGGQNHGAPPERFHFHRGGRTDDGAEVSQVLMIRSRRKGSLFHMSSWDRPGSGLHRLCGNVILAKIKRTCCIPSSLLPSPILMCIWHVKCNQAFGSGSVRSSSTTGPLLIEGSFSYLIYSRNLHVWKSMGCF